MLWMMWRAPVHQRRRCTRAAGQPSTKDNVGEPDLMVVRHSKCPPGSWVVCVCIQKQTGLKPLLIEPPRPAGSSEQYHTYAGD